MRPQFPTGPGNRAALYLLGLLAALKALSLVLIGQAVASMLAGLMGGIPAWDAQLYWGVAGVALRALTVWAQAVASRRAALGVKEELRSQLLERALRGGARSAGPADGGLAILATRGLDALDNYYTQFLPALVNCAAIPLLLGARILSADWISAVVIVLTVPLVPIFMILIGRYTDDRVREAQSALARLSGHMLELAKGLPVLVGLGRASAQRKALEDLSEEYRHRTMGTLRTAFLSALALELIATISVAVVAVFIGVRLVHGDMALEAGLLALILAPDCYLPLRELGTAHHASDDGRAALAETTTVLQAHEPTPLRPEAGAGTASTPGAGAAPPPALQVSALTVRYGGRADAVVGPLSFTAAAGRITALDGPSGAGKSTVLGVLAGTVGDGGGPGQEATVTGRLGGFTTADLAWVPQHPVMVAPTVLAEVRLYLGAAAGSAPAAPGDAAALRCLAACAAEHLAAKHPAELSPGELRRVALARGLARIEAGATVLLLDEPTAHLDRNSATAVSTAIAGLRGKVTVLLVAHDRQTRELADQLVAVAPGAVAPGGALAAGTVPAPVGRTATVAGLAATTRPGTAAPHLADGSQIRPVQIRRVQTRPTRPQPAEPARPSTAARLRRLLQPVGPKFAAAGVVGTLAALFAVALSGLSGWLIIRASEQPPILYLLTAIVGVRFFGIGRAALRYLERLLLHDAVFAALTRLRGRLWESLSRRALSLRRLLQGGNVLGTVVDDVDTVRELLPRVVLPPLTAVAVAAGAVTGIALLLPAALPAVVAAALLSLVAAPALALAADRMSAGTEQRLRSGVLRQVAAALDARADLHANHVAAPVLAAIIRADRSATAASQRSAWAEGLGQGLTVLACGTAALASAVLAAPLVSSGAAEASTVAVVVLLQLALVEPYAAITTAVRQYPALRAVLDRIGEAGVLDAGAAAASSGLVPVAGRAGGKPGIELRNLAAAWPGGPEVFTGVTATAEPGRWLAVTGTSGSGKSTLLAVVLGFLPAAGGHIGLSGRAAWCPQEAHLFDSTIRGNLLLGLPDDRRGESSDPGLADALSAVGLGPLIGRLEHGLDTRIGPGGAFLSGGERQRLAVARTLLTGADVILLDEPTAHLDAESGEAMLAELRHGLRNRTVVLVTHNPEDIAAEDDRLDLDLAAGRSTPASGPNRPALLARG
ncbi:MULTISPECIES: thiol reductant ABC exporter subunit CydD [unclassified Arthrobacter]|uniref:thiol reductant ABC exporter subunit CydD n=1 Tax=unclassified Arthrobacter TaxID=235627 RepID=UPI002E0CD439|nr:MULTISPECIES: thiol reductant ABC exporter subunit CydD [unclassified Arthrobacter]MEC5192467.1 ATP-binding cassette subfamily C protein CydCD [Arthrobacter sp. MP_M4]MEC5203951.1 ATP-binding cassette subfamily C protein CydCD [Arthrobacter sp. MP_M7]